MEKKDVGEMEEMEDHSKSLVEKEKGENGKS